MEKELTKYYRSISKHLPVDRKRKRRILEMIRQSVENYLSEHPDADMNGILENIGKPQEIAASYIENMTTPEVLRKFRIRKIALTIISAVAGLALLIWLAVVTIALISDYNRGSGFVVVGSAEEITEGTGEIK